MHSQLSLVSILSPGCSIVKIALVKKKSSDLYGISIYMITTIATKKMYATEVECFFITGIFRNAPPAVSILSCTSIHTNLKPVLYLLYYFVCKYKYTVLQISF